MPDSYRSRWSGMAFHSFLQRLSAPRKMVHLPSLSGNSIYSITVKSAFYDRSRMTGRHIIPFCKKLFYVSAHTFPFHQLRWHFPRQTGTACVPYSFFAPWKVVRLLPDKRGRLTKWRFLFLWRSRRLFLCASFHYFFIFTHIKTAFLIDGFSLSVPFLRIPAVILLWELCFLCFPRNNWRPLLRLHRSCVLS